MAVGCHFPRPQPRKPNLYEVRGRVIDADTNQAVPHARVRLRATIAGAVGVQYLTGYAVSRADGTYRAELSATFDVMRGAAEIRLDASKKGYIPGGADLPPPARKRDYYEAPDIVVKQGETPPRPADIESLGVPLSLPTPDDLPWKRRREKGSRSLFPARKTPEKDS
ncbi:MAG: carboxypeptidase-like regulatory domain-containing protein [Planctomycetota bacterium]|nr:carboxypeptidase-like regulatory domain-containing protein [Planctomycetota bacterium]